MTEKFEKFAALHVAGDPVILFNVWDAGSAMVAEKAGAKAIATGSASVATAHGYADAELSQNFKRLNASTDNWHGFPSSMIEGSYDLNGHRMHSYNRIVIPTTAPPANQRYLVQFTVTGYAEKAAEEAPDIEAVIAGFDVKVPPK